MSTTASTPKRGRSPSQLAREGVDMLMTLMEKCRALGEREHDYEVLNMRIKRREADLRLSFQREKEYPAIAAILKQSRSEDIPRRDEVAEEIQLAKDALSQLCNQFLVHITTRSSSIASNHGRNNSSSSHAKPVHQDPFRQSTEARLLNAKTDMLKLKEENQELKRQVTDMKAGVSKLAEMVASLSKRMDSAPTTQAATDMRIEEKGTQMDDVPAEKKRDTDSGRHQPEKRGKQGKQRKQIETGKPEAEGAEEAEGLERAKGQSDAKDASPVKGAASAVSTLASQTVSFPGDDFTSVRFDIGKLGERLTHVEALEDMVGKLSQTQTEILAGQSANMEKVYKSNDKLAEVFGKLLEDEAEAREQVAEQLWKLEETVSLLRPVAGDAQAAAAEVAVPDVPAADREAERQAKWEAERQAERQVEREAEAREKARTEAVLADLGAGLDACKTDLLSLGASARVFEADAKNRFAALELMATSLDNQYNNLSTKELFTYITGYMNTIYPNKLQLQQDLVALGGRVQRLEQTAESMHDSGRNVSLEAAGPKRRRLDDMEVTGHWM